MPEVGAPAATGKLGFVLVSAFIDVPGIGLIIPVMPLIGSAILGAVSHLPPDDARTGSTFFLSGAMQGMAVPAARHYFRRGRADVPM
jgi:DHA1 family tetracycline resistance protein-like MFS transporter